jgi:hypothetical protein
MTTSRVTLVLKHTGRVPFDKYESKNLTVSEGDHLATYCDDRDITGGKGSRTPRWAANPWLGVGEGPINLQVVGILER